MEYIASLFSGELTWLDIIIRVAVAVLIGALIGVERELSNHPAGMKTHALVCLGAAITTMISAEMCYSLMGNEALDQASKVDMSRIASGVVSGVGFIGAGAIIKSKDGSVVTGITTAATVWISGCMGLAIGMGYFRIITIAMLAIIFTTGTLRRLEDKFIKHRGIRFIEVITNDKKTALPMIEDYFDRKQIVITSFDCTSTEDSDDTDKSESGKYCCRYFLRIPKSVPFNVVMRDIAKMEEVEEIYESNSSSASSKKTTHSQV
ncbi:MAG: MgtC/SapB family protein [Clostridiales bacterium]|nr:MgtC/SapB family protein [Clostridiales bacterium]